MVLASLPTQAAQGFLITKETTFYKNPSTDKKADRAIVKMLPGQSFFPAKENGGPTITLDTTCFSFHAASQSFNQGKDPKRLYVIGTLNAALGWEKGWVDKSAGEVFDYEVTTRRLNCPRLGGGNPISWDILDQAPFAKAVALKLDEIKFRDFKPPSVEHTHVFEHEFPDVWSALIETLSDAQVPFELVEKNSGLLTTKTVPDPLKDTMVCATKYDADNRVKFNIFVKDAGNGTTQVKVNPSFVAMKEDQPINCSSNGSLEKWIFDGIYRILGGEKEAPATAPQPTEGSP